MAEEACSRAVEAIKRILREIGEEARWLWDVNFDIDSPWASVKVIAESVGRDLAAQALRHYVRLRARQRALVRALGYFDRVCGSDKWLTYS